MRSFTDGTWPRAASISAQHAAQRGARHAPTAAAAAGGACETARGPRRLCGESVTAATLSWPGAPPARVRPAWRRRARPAGRPAASRAGTASLHWWIYGTHGGGEARVNGEAQPRPPPPLAAYTEAEGRSEKERSSTREEIPLVSEPSGSARGGG